MNAAAEAPDATEPGSRTLTPLALAGVVLGLAAALSVQLSAAPLVLRMGAGPLLLFGAWPLLVRATPGPVSPAKLLLHAGLLSPVLFGTLDVVLRLTVARGEGASDTALTITLVVIALAQLAGLGTGVRRAPLGAGTWVALALAAAVAGWSAWMLLRGNATRVSYHGLLHSGLALATERNLPPTNPWLADAGLGYYWAWHALGGTVARALRLAPTEAFAWIGVWAAGFSTLAVHQLSSVLLRDWRREVIAVLLAVLGLNALGGYLALANGALSAAPGSSGELLATLRENLVPATAGGLLWDPRVAFGLSKLGNLSSYPASLALLLGGWAAAGHALRHGRRPWVAIAAVAHGASLALNPLVGAAGVGVTGLAALVGARSPRARWWFGACLLVAAIPGALLVTRASAAYSGAAVGFVFDPARVIAVGGPLALLSVPALHGLRVAASKIGRTEDRRATLVLVGLAAVLPAAVALVVELPYANEYKFVRLAAFPLGILAAAGLVDGWRRGGSRRLAAAAWGTATGVGALAALSLGTSAYAHLAGRDLPLVEADRSLAPATGGAPAADDVAAAYRHLATDPALRELGPALVTDVTRPSGLGFGAEGYRFTSADNLQAHEAVAFAAVDLWVDRPSQVLAAADPLFARRLGVLAELFGAQGDWSAAVVEEVFESSRPLVMLVGARERQRRATLDDELLAAGCDLVFEAGTARLYLSPGHTLPSATPPR